jgi:phage pi2 protein 07
MPQPNALVSISVDESEVREMLKQKIADLVKEVDTEYVFWDTAELKRRTCMSWNTIQEAFFHDPRFVKRKVGSKWYFPARETRAFLEQWLREQPF